MGINTTGAPDTKEYLLGRGIGYFAFLGANNLPDVDGYRDLGNISEFKITVAVSDLKHYSTRTGLKVLDKTFVITQEVGVTFKLDNTGDFNNGALFFSGQTGTFDNGHDTTAVKVKIVSAMKLGRWYDLYNKDYTDSTRRRVYDLTAMTAISFYDDQVSDVLLVEGVDYELDRVMGRIRILPTSVAAIAGDQLLFSATAAGTPKDLDEVASLTKGLIEGALKFVSDNPGNVDEKTEYQFHHIQIAADGDFDLISDNVTVQGFKGSALINSSVPDVSKVLTMRTYTPQ